MHTGGHFDMPTRTDTVVAWCHEQAAARLNAGQGVPLPELTSEAIRHFRSEPAFIDDLLVELLRPAVYRVLQQTVAESRKPHRMTNAPPDMSRQDRLALARARRWDTWLERVRLHDTSATTISPNAVIRLAWGHRLLMDLTKADLLEAASERLRQVETSARCARLFEQMAGHMDDGQRVRDVFSAAQIERLYETIQQEGDQNVRRAAR